MPPQIEQMNAWDGPVVGSFPPDINPYVRLTQNRVGALRATVVNGEYWPRQADPDPESQTTLADIWTPEPLPSFARAQLDAMAQPGQKLALLVVGTLALRREWPKLQLHDRAVAAVQRQAARHGIASDYRTHPQRIIGTSGILANVIVPQGVQEHAYTFKDGQTYTGPVDNVAFMRAGLYAVLRRAVYLQRVRLHTPRAGLTDGPVL